ncbi:hypothetical protein [Streptomyces glaucosporus]|uniref:hypothetical protein n=1 Tax=Streptomyces glaucosporus TaxID=284044 RepID=UPI0031DB0EF9
MDVPLRSDVDHVVLEIYAKSDGPTYFRIDPGQGAAPALFDSRYFDITSAEMPRCWSLRATNHGSLFIGPSAWGSAGFWEDYFDGKSQARTEYERWKAVIIEDSTGTEPFPSSL